MLASGRPSVARTETEASLAYVSDSQGIQLKQDWGGASKRGMELRRCRPLGTLPTGVFDRAGDRGLGLPDPGR